MLTDWQHCLGKTGVSRPTDFDFMTRVVGTHCSNKDGKSQDNYIHLLSVLTPNILEQFCILSQWFMNLLSNQACAV